MNRVGQVTMFDATDLHAESAFCAGILGGHVFEDDDQHSVIDTAWRVAVHRRPPQFTRVRTCCPTCGANAYEPR
jgi:hypothetical protein